MKYAKKVIALFAVFTLALSGMGRYYTVQSVAQEKKSTAIKLVGKEGRDYAKGEVIVSLVAPSKKDSDLLSEGEEIADDVVVDDVLDFGDAEEIAEDSEEEKEFKDERFYVSVITSDVLSTAELIEKYKDEEGVLSVQPNYRVKAATNDSLFKDQWAVSGSEYGRTPDGQVPKGINYSDQSASGASVKESVVAVVDEGVDYEHEDLKNVMWNNPYQDKGLAGQHGYDFVDDDDDPMPDSDESNHGTHVAGIIAAETNNGVGIAGASEGVKLMSCKVMEEDNDRSGKESSIFSAFEYIYKAQQLGVNISAINCSFGNSPSDTYINNSAERSVYKDIIKKVGSNGAIFVFAAGNESTDVTKNNKAFPYYLDRDYIVTVGASNYKDEASYLSNYSKKEVDIFAPGAGILSTVHEDTFLPSTYTQDKRDKLCLMYDEFSGDSLGVSVKTAKDLGLTDTTILTIDRSDEDFYGKGKGGSMAVHIAAATAEKPISASDVTFYIEIPGGIDVVKNAYYYSFDITADSIGGLENKVTKVWDFFQGQLKKTDGDRVRAVTIGGKAYMKFDITKFMGIIEGEDIKDDTLYIDNLALSVADPDVSQFGKYAYKNGTSMAAPYVSGAIARLASLYPKDNAPTRKLKLLQSVRTVSALKDKCSTGGVIDVSKFTKKAIKNLTVKVSKVKLNKSTLKLKAGKQYTLKATVTPDYAAKTAVTWTSNNTKYATVTKKGVVKALRAGKGHTVKITATARDGSKKKAVCKVTIA